MADTPKWELAYEDYKKGMKYKDIADKYGVGESAVKNWVRRYWGGKVSKKVSKITPKVSKKVSEQKGDNLKGKKEKAPQGGGTKSQNPKTERRGRGAPFDNRRAVTHGAYETIFADDFTDEEKEQVKAMTADSVTALQTALEIAAFREIKMQKRLKAAEAQKIATKGEDGERSELPLAFASVTTDEGEKTLALTPKSVQKESAKSGKGVIMQTETHKNKVVEMRPVIETILNIEHGRSINLREFRQIAAQLHKLGIDSRRIDLAELNAGASDVSEPVVLTGDGDILD